MFQRSCKIFRRKFTGTYSLLRDMSFFCSPVLLYMSQMPVPIYKFSSDLMLCIDD